jgi:aryl sulfotransferase
LAGNRLDGEGGVIPTIWLASYPKSGNTWLRMLIANLSSTEAPVDINILPGHALMAGVREIFDRLLLIDSGMLTDDEADVLRPRVYEEQARGATDGGEDTLGVRFVKVHDAYTLTPNGEPLLAGRRGAAGAIVIVRDPRDVAPSLAAHNRSTIDEAITFMANPSAAFSVAKYRQLTQFRQKLPRWSGHVASWLEQKDIPVHLIRYEDLVHDPFTSFRRALNFAGCSTDDDAIRRAVAFADFAQLRAQESEKGFREAPPQAGPFFRRGVTGGWRDELTPAQVMRVEADHGAMMQRLGYTLSTKPRWAWAG